MTPECSGGKKLYEPHTIEVAADIWARLSYSSGRRHGVDRFDASNLNVGCDHLSLEKINKLGSRRCLCPGSRLPFREPYRSGPSFVDNGTRLRTAHTAILNMPNERFLQENGYKY